MTIMTKPGPIPPQQEPLAEGAHPPLYSVRMLTQGGSTALIQLDDKVYTLRVTRAGKLILTK